MAISRLTTGALFSALAGIVAVTMAAIVKWGSHAFSTEFLTAVRFGAGFLVFLVVSVVWRRALPYRTTRLGTYALLAACWAGGILCCYFAVRFIRLTDAMLLVYTSPLFAPLLNRLFWGKTETPSVWLGIAVGFVGVVVVLRPGTGILQVPALIGLAAGLLIAVRLAVNASIARSESRDVINFYSLGLGWLMTLAVLAVTGFHVGNWERHLFPPREWLEPWIVFPTVLLAVVALGVLSMLQPWFTTASYEYATVGEVGPFRYVAIILAGLLDWIGWGQVPDLSSVLGFLLISAGGVWVITQGGKRLPERRPRTIP